MFCPVSKLQKRIYEEILELPKCKMLLQLDVKCRCGSNVNGRKCCLKVSFRTTVVSQSVGCEGKGRELPW